MKVIKALLPIVLGFTAILLVDYGIIALWNVRDGHLVPELLPLIWSGWSIVLTGLGFGLAIGVAWSIIALIYTKVIKPICNIK